MTAFNVVRFKVKPGFEQAFVDAHRRMQPAFKGFLGGNLIRTGDRTFCVVGEWRAFRSIEVSRPAMIALLDEMRHMLEDLGGELGVTDPVSGEAVAKLAAPRAAKKKKKKKTAPRKSTRAKAAKTRKAGKAAGKRRR